MKINQGKKLKISVRQLVEFVLRGGDLDSRLMGRDRGVEGTRGHQRVQRTYLKEDLAEVTLAYAAQVNGYQLEVSGRADGVLFRQEGVIIDEIKTVTRPLDTLGELENPLHWGQAKIYGFIYGAQQNLERMTIQLTYYQLSTGEIRQARQAYEVLELEAFFYQMLQAYLGWGKWIHQWRRQRDASIQRLTFPFTDYRKGQRNLAVGVFKTIKENKRLFAKAPTGIGKTMSTLFPAIKAMGEGYTAKVFYLTAKTITRSVAEGAIYRLQQNGLDIKALTITAKDKTCFNVGASCNPEECQYAKGYFNRVNQGLEDLFQHESLYTREVVEVYAQKHNLCPFEFALEISLWVDCVICDYNYVFDPRVYLKRFFYDVQEPYVFLVDEAHNLVDRGREMFSSTLNKQSFLEIKRLMKDLGHTVVKRATQVNSQFLQIKKRCGIDDITVDPQPPEELYPALYHFAEAAEEWLLTNEKSLEQEKLLELYFQVMGFLRMSDLFDERYVTLLERQEKDFVVRLYCLDPSYLLRQATNRGSSAVFFSATLAPLPFYKEILGGDEEDYAVGLASPFERENLCLMIANGISTKYRDRQHTYETIVSYLFAATQAKKGNYLVFFPSYQYMDRVYGAFADRYPQIKLMKQHAKMSEQDRVDFLGEFHQAQETTLLGFTVLGGIFSEGIDLPGDQLIGVVIVGVGLPQLCTELNVVRDYFQQTKGKGYEYAYQYPGFNKVLQAAGRVIRTEHDRGFVLLMDTRYDQTSYRRLFPSQWKQHHLIRHEGDIQKILSDFWNEPL